ncbi:MAG: endonuclease [Paludibacteraceae bacterium]|nr:endonuclease [Paludibacteraceae bacterium]
MKRTILVSMFGWLTVALFAVIPSGYYTSAEGKSADALRQALYQKITSHTNVGYDGLYNVYPTSDVTADGKVWDMYSTCTWTHGQKKCGSYDVVCDCYNREHSVPQSWFSKASPMVADAFHVYPTDGKVNGQRSNYEFGECSGGTSLGGKALGRLGKSTFTGYTSRGTVFEPDDQYKGDFARTYFYMATCYANKCSNWGNTFGSVSGLSQYGVDLFLKWHRQDPVSQKELDRNEAVYAKQKNRNPFIDCPELAEHIWGTKKNVAWYQGQSPVDNIELQQFEVFPNPAKDFLMIVAENVGDVKYQIIDISGKILMSGTTAVNASLTVDGLDNGIYFIRMDFDNQTNLQKFIINK